MSAAEKILAEKTFFVSTFLDKYNYHCFSLKSSTYEAKSVLKSWLFAVKIALKNSREVINRAQTKNRRAD